MTDRERRGSVWRLCRRGALLRILALLAEGVVGLAARDGFAWLSRFGGVGGAALDPAGAMVALREEVGTFEAHGGWWCVWCSGALVPWCKEMGLGSWVGEIFDVEGVSVSI